MLLIVGLGNIGAEYNNTYHNIGFMCLDSFLEENDIKLTKQKYNGYYTEKIIDGEKVIFVKPTTFMNASGKCVSAFKRAFKLNDEDILIICDDYDLDIGKIRYRKSGSAGTHNGLRSLVEELNSTNFKRLRIGIHDENSKMPLINYVLSKIGKNLDAYDFVFEKTNEFLSEYIKNKGKIENKSL